MKEELWEASPTPISACSLGGKWRRVIGIGDASHKELFSLFRRGSFFIDIDLLFRDPLSHCCRE